MDSKLKKEELARLAEELRGIPTYNELADHLERAGSIEAEDAVFEVYMDEFHRRGWTLPE